MWQRNEDWVGTQVEDQFVMIHLEDGRYVALNETAAEAWRILEEPRDEQAIVAELTRQFDIDPQQCRESVDAMLDHMQTMELVTKTA